MLMHDVGNGREVDSRLVTFTTAVRFRCGRVQKKMRELGGRCHVYNYKFVKNPLCCFHSWTTLCWCERTEIISYMNDIILRGRCESWPFRSSSCERVKVPHPFHAAASRAGVVWGEPLLVLLNFNVLHQRFFGWKCREGSVLIIMVEGVMRSLFNEGRHKKRTSS